MINDSVENDNTLPGSMVPTEGDIVRGALSGTTNSKEVGPTGAISPMEKKITNALNILKFRIDQV